MDESHHRVGPQRVARFLGAAVFLLGAVVLTGWIFDIEILKRAAPSVAATMKANTAILFMLTGASLWLSTRRTQNHVTDVCSIVVIFLAALALLERLLDLDVGLDSWAVVDENLSERESGRTAPHTALSFGLLGAALLNVRRAPLFEDWLLLAELFAGVALAVAGTIAIAYFYSATTLYSLTSDTGMAPHTAIGLMAASLAVFALRGDEGMMHFFLGSYPSARMTRRTLAFVIVIPVVAAYFRILGEEAGLYGLRAGTSMLVTTCIVLLFGGVLSSARIARRAENDHRRHLVEIEAMNADLEGRVEERTRDLVTAHAELRASLREKNVLLKEVHHRVKNNLQVISSLVSLQADSLRDAHERVRLKEFQGRVRTIALAHEKLYQSADLARIDFEDYVRSLVDGIARTQNAATRGIVTSVDVTSVRLPVDRAISCGLAINELVTSSMARGFENRGGGTVQVTMKNIDDSIELSVADDSHGLPSTTNGGFLGLELVTIFADQLGGEMVVSHERGTEVRLRFPNEMSRSSRPPRAEARSA